MDPLLYVEQLQVIYPNGLVAVINTSFHIAKGEIVGLMGPSGCGKSSIARALLGLNQQSREKVILRAAFGKKRLIPSKLRGKEIALILQNPMSSFNPTMKVGKQIVEGVRYHRRLSYKEAKELALQLLHDVGIRNPESCYESYPHQLSGGQKQRCVIAMALAPSPKLLIADEPTTALDVTIQKQVLNLLKDLCRRRGMSLLFLSHDRAACEFVSDRILSMENGKIVKEEVVLKNVTHRV